MREFSDKINVQKEHVTIACDFDLILRIPSENRALSAECTCDLTLARENRTLARDNDKEM